MRDEEVGEGKDRAWEGGEGNREWAKKGGPARRQDRRGDRVGAARLSPPRRRAGPASAGRCAPCAGSTASAPWSCAAWFRIAGTWWDTCPGCPPGRAGPSQSPAPRHSITHPPLETRNSPPPQSGGRGHPDDPARGSAPPASRSAPSAAPRGGGTGGLRAPLAGRSAAARGPGQRCAGVGVRAGHLRPQATSSLLPQPCPSRVGPSHRSVP